MFTHTVKGIIVDRLSLGTNGFGVLCIISTAVSMISTPSVGTCIPPLFSCSRLLSHSCLSYFPHRQYRKKATTSLTTTSPLLYLPVLFTRAHSVLSCSSSSSPSLILSNSVSVISCEDILIYLTTLVIAYKV